MLFNTEALKKMTITAYSDPEFQDSLGDNYVFTAMINPARFNLTFQNDYVNTQAPGESKSLIQFRRTEPEELSFELLLDCSAAAINDSSGQDTDEEGISKDINLFKKVAYTYNGDIHQPNYVKIAWGTFLFHGKLRDMKIEYQLFGPDGKPIRAKLELRFIKVINEQLGIAEEKKSSPDLTHIRIVKEGDTLPLMTYKIYGDSRYYLEVAKVNNLNMFRKLNPGQRIIFPPIEKTGING